MKKLTEGNIYKNFILFSIPLVLSGLLSAAYHTIDTAIAGRYLGEHGLAAIGATSSFITIISSIIWGYGTGFSVYIARLFGAGEIQKIKRGTVVHMINCAVVTLLVAVVSILFHEPIFDLLKIEEGLRADAFRYFAIYLLGYAIMNTNTNCVFIMNAFGISSFPFYMSVLSAILNVIGNIVTITVFGWGVTGVALATVFSATVIAVCYLLRLRACFRKMDPERKKFRWEQTETRVALSYSIPTMLQQGSMYLAGLVLSPMINKTGSAGIAAYVVTSQISGILMTLFQSASRTVSNYSAQCLGGEYALEEKQSKLRKGLWVGFLQSVVYTLPLLLVFVAFPHAISSIFLSEGSTNETMRIAEFFIRVFLPFLIFKIVDNLFHSFFRGVKAMRLLVICTMFSSVVQIAASALLIPDFGINGYYAGMVISWVAEAIFVLLLYVTGVWRPAEWKDQSEASV